MRPSGCLFSLDEAVKSAKARRSGEGRSPEVSEITGSRLQFIPHFVRGRDDEIGKNSTSYLRISLWPETLNPDKYHQSALVRRPLKGQSKTWPSGQGFFATAACTKKKEDNHGRLHFLQDRERENSQFQGV